MLSLVRFFSYGEMPEAELLNKIIKNEYDYDDPVWAQVSYDAKKLIDSLLQIDPHDRLSLQDFLKSKWINSQHPSTKPLPIVDRLARFKMGKNPFRTIIMAKLASNKFKSLTSQKARKRKDSFAKGSGAVNDPALAFAAKLAALEKQDAMSGMKEKGGLRVARENAVSPEPLSSGLESIVGIMSLNSR